jgi:hypothetical protein
MNVVSLLTGTLVPAIACSAFGQTPAASLPTPLSQLLVEAESNPSLPLEYRALFELKDCPEDADGDHRQCQELIHSASFCCSS